ncbi:MAG: hypothetical protein Alis2KO_41850 [Aliiglaciecola sp.]
MRQDDLEFSTSKSPHDHFVGAHVGVKIRHKPSGIVVVNTNENTQFANKTKAMKELERKLLAADNLGL